MITAVSEVATGGGRHIEDLVSGLVKANRDVEAISLSPGSLRATFSAQGIPVHIVNCRGKFDVGAIAECARILRDLKPVIVHTHGERGMFIGNWAAKVSGVPHIVTTIHRSIAHTNSWSFAKRSFYQAIEDFTLRFTSTQMITVSQAMYSEMVDVRNHRAENVVIIPNGVAFPTETEEQEARYKAGVLRSTLLKDKEGYIVGTIGRLSSEKGNRYLVRAFGAIAAELPMAILVVVGTGPEENLLKQLAEDLGVHHRVFLVGQQMDVLPWLEAFDLFVLPSTWDSFGLVVVEAMGQNVPVVATNVGGPANIVEDGASGLLVVPSNENAIAEAIKKLFSNPILAREMAIEGRKRVRDQYGIDTMIVSTIRFYDRLLATIL